MRSPVFGAYSGNTAIIEIDGPGATKILLCQSIPLSPAIYKLIRKNNEPVIKLFKVCVWDIWHINACCVFNSGGGGSVATYVIRLVQ